ncbi:MAG TPA: 50S ribosomal protein L6 [Armatimonadota bacterium]|nr:50S ribosomal protein L6 [Armatimonadota bacterium]
MSRIGNMPIEIPSGVTVEVSDRNEVTVKGPGGELEQRVPRSMKIEIADGVLTVSRPSDQRDHRAQHGLTRALIANMVQGVTEGFEKRLEIRGVGYRAEIQGRNLELRLGFSQPVLYEPREGVELAVQDLVIIVRGADKQKVGQTAAEIRGVRPVEPYKGKGVRYVGERVRRKAGKAAKVGAEGG